MKALVVVVLALAGAVYAYQRFFPEKDPFPPPPGVAEGSREHLKAIAGKLKAELPRKVDSETTATNVFAREGEMVYTYRLDNYSSREINDKKFGELAKGSLQRKVCGDREIRRMWKHHDIMLSFQYIASDGLSLGYFSVGPRDC